MREEIYILIDRYYAGELSPEEKMEFEKRLIIDGDFAEKVKLYRSLSDSLTSKFQHGKEDLQLRHALSKIADEELGSVKGAKIIKMNRYYWAAAASIVLLLGIFFYTNHSSTPTYSDYADHEPLALIERGSSESAAIQAEEAFNFKNYKQALTSLDDLLKTDNNNIELQLYKGIVLIELSRYKEAEAILSSVRASGSVHQNKAIWYLALSALKQNQFERTKLLLQEIPEGSEEYKQAQKLIKRL